MKEKQTKYYTVSTDCPFKAEEKNVHEMLDIVSVGDLSGTSWILRVLESGKVECYNSRVWLCLYNEEPMDDFLEICKSTKNEDAIKWSNAVRDAERVMMNLIS